MRSITATRTAGHVVTRRERIVQEALDALDDVRHRLSQLRSAEDLGARSAESCRELERQLTRVADRLSELAPTPVGAVPEDLPPRGGWFG